MKKFLKIAFVSILSFCFLTTVNAATESELLEFAKGTYTVAGTQVKADDEFLVVLEEYLNENEVTSEQAQTLIDSAKKILDILDQNGSINPNDLDKATRKEAIKIARDAAAMFGISVNYDSSAKALRPYKDGKEYAPLYLVTLSDGSAVITTVPGKNPAKTGTDYTTYIAFSGVFLILIAGTTLYKKKKNEN